MYYYDTTEGFATNEFIPTTYVHSFSIRFLRSRVVGGVIGSILALSSINQTGVGSIPAVDSIL